MTHLLEDSKLTISSTSPAPAEAEAQAGADAATTPAGGSLLEAPVTIDTLLEAGAHFGHKVSRWNPKMRPFIHGRRNQIHIIDLKQTLRGLLRAQHFLQRIVAQGGEILFVGTKRQVKAITKTAAQSVGMHFVNERWLGGTLTNYQTVVGRLKHLEKLENLEREGGLSTMKKKQISSFNREKRKLLRNLEGIRHMAKLPSVVIAIDPRREHIALRETKKTKIPSIAIIDTDGDPDPCDICIPANDDAFRSVQIILGGLCRAIAKGKSEFDTGRQIVARGGAAGQSRSGSQGKSGSSTGKKNS